MVSDAEEDATQTHQHAAEGAIVYTGGCPPRAGRSRKVPLAAKKIETMTVLCPVQRSKIKCAKKEQFTACGEESTYQGTYSGVSYRSTSEIMLVPKGEKAAILGHSADVSPPDDWLENHANDVPLFWHESKPIAFWQALLDDWLVQTVVDCTPGSGALMEACLTRGVQYHAICAALSQKQDVAMQVRV